MKNIILAIIAISVLSSSFDAVAQSERGDMTYRNSSKTERNLVIEGNKLYNEGKYHEALNKYEQALAINPSYQYALYDKAVTLAMLGNDDNKNTKNDTRVEAAKIFEQIGKTNSNPDLAAKSFYNLGNMAFNDNNFGRAIDMYKHSLKIYPDSKECRQNLLLALQKQEEQEQNQDQQEQNQDQQQQEQQQEQQQDQQQQQQEQEQQQPQMTQSAEQLLQAMQNKENATRRRVNREEKESQPANRSTDKPW